MIDDAGLPLEAEFLFENVDGAQALFRGQGVLLGGIDVGVVEPLLAPRAFGEGLPAVEGVFHVGDGVLDLQNGDVLVRIHPLKVVRKLFRRSAGAALNDQARGPPFGRRLPRACEDAFLDLDVVAEDGLDRFGDGHALAV